MGPSRQVGSRVPRTRVNNGDSPWQRERPEKVWAVLNFLRGRFVLLLLSSDRAILKCTTPGSSLTRSACSFPSAISRRTCRALPSVGGGGASCAASSRPAGRHAHVLPSCTLYFPSSLLPPMFLPSSSSSLLLRGRPHEADYWRLRLVAVRSEGAVEGVVRGRSPCPGGRRSRSVSGANVCSRRG